MTSKRATGMCLMAMLFLFMTPCLHAQDTVRISLPEADNRFLQKNLTVLAQRYNIDIARAQIIQAGLYNNPNIQVTAAAYNPEQKKAFDISDKTGEYIINAQQLILLAGKRNKQVKLAQTNALLAESDFYDLLRTLRYTLHSDFFDAYFLQNSINAYQAQIASLESLNDNYQSLAAKGIVTLKDAVRIKSLLYSLRAEQAGLRNQFNDTEAEIQLLLQDNHSWFIPVSNADSANIPSVQKFPLQSLLDSAYANRYDLKKAKDYTTYTEQNYALQKALAVPDLTIGAQFDKRGSFVENASFLTLGIDLPFFNRNQGNIRASRLATEQGKLLLDQQKATVENQVQQALVRALSTERMATSIDPHFRQQFEELLQSVVQNFQKKNISLLEFTDFYDSYKQNILQLNQLQNDRVQALENLNYIIGKNIIQF